MATAPEFPARLTSTPDGMPMLSRGRHRSARSGACFMELASYLAGERWSDHPKCTHPLLASVARRANDYTSDAGRPRLVPLIPAVIGLRAEDLRVDVALASLCARTALPRVGPEHQRVLAVSLLTSGQVLEHLGGAVGPAATETTAVRDALRVAPAAERWAREFTRRARATPRGFRRHAGPGTVRYAIDVLARARPADLDDLLYALLLDAIEVCRRHAPPSEPQSTPEPPASRRRTATRAPV